MGVQTQADKNLDAANEAVQTALIALNEIVILECEGHDEYNEQYTKDIAEAFALIRKAKSLLRAY